MNIKTKLLKTLCLFTSVIGCNNIYSTEKVKEINVIDFNKDFLDTCGVVDTDPNDDKFGRLFYPKDSTENNREWLIYDGYPCFDLKLMTESKLKQGNYINFPESIGNNLVVKTYDSNINACILDSNNTQVLLESNTNLIIPKGITLGSKYVTIQDSNDHLNGINNCNVLLFGCITDEYRLAEGESFLNFYINKGNNNHLIIGPNATYKHASNSGHSISPMIMPSNVTIYPGCEIYPGREISTVSSSLGDDTRTIRQSGNLYLNRYTKYNDNNGKLQGTITDGTHIIFSKNCEDENSINNWKTDYKLEKAGETQSGNTKYVKTNYFPNLYWITETDDAPSYSTTLGESQTYHFEDQLIKPLSFNDDGKGKQVLGLNPNNSFAKYDAILWDQCSPDNEYGLNAYNISENKEVYIDVNTLEDLFYNGGTYKPNNDANEGLLNNMPETIYCGLIGDKNIAFNSEIISFSGDNTLYNGTITTDNVIDIYNKNALVKCKNIYNPLRLNSSVIWDLDKFGNNLPMNLSSDSENHCLHFVDNSLEKKDTLYFSGNNYNYNIVKPNRGIIYIPSTIKKIEFTGERHYPLLVVSKRLYYYTHIDTNNTLSFIRDVSGNGLESIKLNGEELMSKAEVSGSSIYDDPRNCEFTLFVGYEYFNKSQDPFDNTYSSEVYPPLIDRAEIKNMEYYNRKGINWDVSDQYCKEYMSSLINYNENDCIKTSPVDKDHAPKQSEVYVNKFEECFIDGKTYNPTGSMNKEDFGLLKNFPINILNNELKVNLIGNKDITLYSQSNIDTVTFSGNNSGYISTITIPHSINKILFGENSLVNVNHLQEDGSAENDLSKLTFYLYGNNTLDLKMFGSELSMNLDNTTYTNSTSDLDLVNTGDTINELRISGNNSKYNGNILTPLHIRSIEFKDDNSKVKIKPISYFYTGIDNNNTLSYINDTNSNMIQSITVGDTTYTNNETEQDRQEMFNSFFGSGEIVRRIQEEIKNLDLYNKEGVTWDTNTLEECFIDGETYNPTGSTKDNKKGLLNNIPIYELGYEIKANLTGNKDITLYSQNNTRTLNFFGNNTCYNGTITIPLSILFLEFKDYDSKLKIKQTAYFYTGIDNNNTLSLIRDINNGGIQSITIGDTKYTSDETDSDRKAIFDSFFCTDVTMEANRDEIKKLVAYNKEGVTWNTDTLEECFIDGETYKPTGSIYDDEKGLLNNIPIYELGYEIKANLTGSKNMCLYFPSRTDIIRFSGNNTHYNGSISFFKGVDTVQFAENSYIGSQFFSGKKLLFTGNNDFVLNDGSLDMYNRMYVSSLILQGSNSKEVILNIISNNKNAELVITRGISGTNYKLNVYGNVVLSD